VAIRYEIEADLSKVSEFLKNYLITKKAKRLYHPWTQSKQNKSESNKRNIVLLEVDLQIHVTISEETTGSTEKYTKLNIDIGIPLSKKQPKFTTFY
jgi:5-enolpyruvylshikimate-3-phosphate synthase